MMHIEKFSEEYLDDVCKIEEVCFAHPWSKKDLAKQLELTCTSFFYVAVEDEKAVGYMGIQVFGFEGYVTNVAVLPEYRGRGYATALINKAMELPLDFITLEVRASNDIAIKLYEKAGLNNVGVRPNFYSDPDEDAVIMTKRFND